MRSLFSVFLSLSILLIGHGLQQTLLPLHAQSIGWSAAEIGLTGSAYYLGLILGCLQIPKLIRRVGHIRVFTVCVSLAIVSLLVLSRWQLLGVWLVARLLTGWCFAGLYMVLESWLNEQSPNASRGMVLSLYGFLSLAAMSVGQLLIGDDTFLSAAAMAACIFALAVVPVGLTSNPQPAVPKEIQLDFRFAYRASEVAPVMACVSGVVMGLVWSNGAVYASEMIGSPEAGANFILFTLLGGFVCQLPLGRLSDRFDRRWILLFLGIVASIASIAIHLRPIVDETALCALGFVLGGTAMPMYSIGIAHANDNAAGNFLVIASVMLVVNGIGSTVAPLLYALLKALEFGDVYFQIIGVVYGLGVVWTAYRLLVHDATARHFEPFQTVPRTTLGVAALDPRQDQDDPTR